MGGAEGFHRICNFFRLTGQRWFALSGWWVELLPHVEEFQDLKVLFTDERQTKYEIDRQISAKPAVMQQLYRSVVIK